MVFFSRLPPRGRQRLLDALHGMAQNPPHQAPVLMQDAQGRVIQVWRNRGFEILFWIDHSGRELRIVEIDFHGEK